VEGNSKLEVSRSVAQIVGPGLAGALAQVFSAPVAVGVDALSYVASFGSLLFIQTAEPPPIKHEGKDSGMWSQLPEEPEA
jgi:hypothetical protein